MRRVVILIAVAWAGTTPAAGGDKPRTTTFSKGDLAKVPAGWTAGHTNKGGKGSWTVAADPTAPGKTGHVLAQTGESPSPVFNLCVADAPAPADVEVSVMFKANDGAKDQGGGVVWRYADPDNYYVARFNPLEDNYRLYKVIAGRRVQLATREDVKAPAGEWHELTVRMAGDRIECLLDGKKLLEATDDAFRKAGKVGLWTKADARTSFDRFTVVGVKK